MTLRILHFVGITVTFAIGPWFVALPWMLFYIVWWRGLEIVVVTFMADTLYGSSSPVPLYSTAALCAYIVWETIRPRLLIYTNR